MSTQPLTSDRFEFEDAVEAMEFYFDRGWTDGLPIVPPTVERVREFLEYAGRGPSEIVGTEPTKGRVITAEKVAVNSVMAGCLPEYLPVVLAAVEAMSEPKFNLHAVGVSTDGAGILTVVNGPIAGELEINSGVGVFGPGHRANATIGRAVRLVISNVTGAVPGVLSKSTIGHGGQYTWCMAEAEETSPWEPLHVERGFAADQSTVTVFAGLSPVQVENFLFLGHPSPLTGFADPMYVAGPDRQEVVVVLAPECVGFLKAAGMSKMQVKEELFELTQRKVSDWIRAGVLPPGGSSEELDRLVGVAPGPDNITVLVAGGAAGVLGSVVPHWAGGYGSQSVTKLIRSPA